MYICLPVRGMRSHAAHHWAIIHSTDHSILLHCSQFHSLPLWNYIFENGTDFMVACIIIICCFRSSPMDGTNMCTHKIHIIFTFFFFCDIFSLLIRSFHRPAGRPSQRKRYSVVLLITILSCKSSEQNE